MNRVNGQQATLKSIFEKRRQPSHRFSDLHNLVDVPHFLSSSMLVLALASAGVACAARAQQPETRPGPGQLGLLAAPSAPPSAWEAKVQMLQTRAAQGEIPIRESLTSLSVPQTAIPWSATDALVLERSQTWWMEKGWAVIHIANKTAHELGALALDYGGNVCGQNEQMTRFQLYISPALMPGTEALVRFGIPVETSRWGCLDIAGAWRGL